MRRGRRYPAGRDRRFLAERRGRLRLAFLLAIGTVFVALGALDVLSAGPGVYAAMWLFFVGFNYLEATLPSLLSKSVAADNKGAAMGVFSACQFLGAFAGGDPLADLAPPFGVLDLADITRFVNAFSGGCP